MTEQEIYDLCGEWKQRLGLYDWMIAVRPNCKPEDMSEQNVSGSTTYNEVCKAAVIELIDPQYYGERIVPLDLEKTFVHELLHLKMSLIADNVGEFQERYVHQLINDLAAALVNAKRAGEIKESEKE